MLEVIGKNELEEFIWENHLQNKIIVIYFGAEWCGPCEALKERLESEEAIEEMPNLSVAYVDIDNDENDDICDIYRVKGLPSQFFIKLDDNNVVIIKNIIGYDWINFRLTYSNLSNE